MRKIPGCSLWLGNVGDAWDPTAILSQGIRAVVDLALDERPVLLPRELVYCRFPLQDGAGNSPWLLRLTIEIATGLVRADIPVLVFCGAGMSRSPCIAGVALALARGCSPAEGLEMVTKSGPKDIAPAFWRDVQEAAREFGTRER